MYNKITKSGKDNLKILSNIFDKNHKNFIVGDTDSINNIIKICICPNCRGSCFNIIEQSITKRKKRSFTINGMFHYHNHGIHQEKRKCLKCGCIFIFRTKDTCRSCDFNSNYKPQVIIIKNGK